MPKKKKKDDAPLKKKQLLKLHVQELEESLRSATGQRDGLAAKLATLEKDHKGLVTSHNDLATRHTSLLTSEKELVTRHTSLATAFKELESKHASLASSEKSVTTEREALKAKLAALEKEHKELVTRHSSLVTSHNDLITRHSPLVTAFKELEARNSSLLVAEQDLSRAVQGLEKKNTTLASSSRLVIDERDSIRAELASLQADQLSLVAERDELAARHLSLLNESEALRSKHASLTTLHSRLTAERDSLVASEKAAKEESELLVQQLHQVQEELEHYFLQNKKLRTEALAAPAGAALEIEALHFGRSEDSPPHRHLDFDIEGLRMGTISVPSMHLRLVDHHGRAGMVVFATPEGKLPLQTWREDGRDGDHAFLLVVPQDEAGRSYIREADARDLIILRQAALLAASHLAQGTPVSSSLPASFWTNVARNFVAFSDEANDSLRLGEVAIKPGESPDAFHFSIGQALLAGRVLPPLCGSWSEGHLRLELPAGGNPPLTAWPRHEDGRFAQNLDFSFERGDRDEQKKLRATLTKQDRRTLEALLEALPGIVDRYPPAAKDEGSTPPEPFRISPKAFRKAADAFCSNGRRLGLLSRI
jgi:hypothetical protein